MNLYLYFLLFSLIFAVPPLVFSEILECEVKDSETKECSSTKSALPSMTDYLGWFLIPFGGLVGGLVAYFLKRSFVKQDAVSKKQIEHEHWLMQQFHKLGDTHYFPLAKFARDTGMSIERSSISLESKSIEIAFYYFCIFMKKYFEFKISTGANFMFRNQNMENDAIRKFHALLIGLPFDDLELQNLIQDSFNDGKFTVDFSSNEYFTLFKIWISSNTCQRSRLLVIEKLKNLARILDKGAEETSHPKSYDTQIEKTPLKQEQSFEDFWIIGLSKKSAKSGDTLIIFGKGFTNSFVNYDFYIGNLQFLRIIRATDDFVELKIPERISAGIYDVYANFKVERWYRNIQETIGIPLTIVNP